LRFVFWLLFVGLVVFWLLFGCGCLLQAVYALGKVRFAGWLGFFMSAVERSAYLLVFWVFLSA